MTYLVLVSHGRFAYGLHDALEMFSEEGDPSLISCCLEKDMDVDVYIEKLRGKLAVVNPEEDMLVLMGDLRGGSPLTNAMNVVSEMGMLDRTPVYAGMNMPLALNAHLQKEGIEYDEADETFMEGADIQRVILETENNEEDDI